MTDRRSSAAPAPKIPPAPPPPPPRQRHRSYFERFVAQPLTTYANRPSSVQANRPDGGPPNPLVPRLPGYVCVSFRPAALDTMPCAGSMSVLCTVYASMLLSANAFHLRAAAFCCSLHRRPFPSIMPPYQVAVPPSLLCLFLH
jgi:hypothetical protein